LFEKKINTEINIVEKSVYHKAAKIA